MKVKISIKVPFYPTENKDKVIECVQNLIDEIPDYQEENMEDYKLLVFNDINVKSIEKFFNYIRNAEILDAVRRCSSIDFSENSLILSFHKQALHTGKFAVITSDTSSPLGNVELRIEGRDPEKILDWIAPQTEEGREITHRRFNDIFNL